MPDIAIATRSQTKISRSSIEKPALRNILRDATSTDHAQLDRRFSGFDLHDLAGYRRFLESSAAALLPLEGALVAAGVRDILPDWDRHRRSRAILSDLATIGGTAHLLDPPVLNGRYAVLGTLYVLEGSRLGATYLLRHVSRASDPCILNATAYLGHGAGLHLWQNFLDVLESHAGELRDNKDIIGPARRAFDLFSRAVLP